MKPASNIVPKQGRAIRLSQVCDLVAASRATVWRWSRADGTFPKPFRLGPAVTAWDEREILDWIEDKKAMRLSGN
jgi:predicted DNA-binding transcriptional regulator AlpA